VTWARDGAPAGTGTGPDANCAKSTSTANNGGLGVSAGSNTPTCIDITYLNSVANDSDFDQFQAIVDLLFAEGLSTEHVERVSRYGAPFAVKASGDSDRQTAALIQAYAAASQAGLKVAKAGENYQLQKNDTSYRFCFRDFGAVPRNSPLLCGRGKNADEASARSAGDSATGGQGEVNAGGSTGFNLTLSGEAQRTLSSRLQQATARISPKAIPLLANMHVTSFQLQLRSTEGIIYYLGELTRRHLYPEQGKFPDENQPRIIKVPTQVPDGAMPRIACDGESSGRSRHTELIYPNDKGDPSGASRGPASSYFCDDIFVVDRGTSDAFIAVSYDGSSFGLASGSDRSGRTYQVLELAKQILAVNTSAKQLPATSVVVISQP
jgi:hypothetical protein